MNRFLALAVVGCLIAPAATPAGEKKKPAPQDDVTINGQIVVNDLPDKVKNHPCKIHSIKMSKDKTYIIDLESRDFDAYLRVEDSAGNKLAQDDDGGEGLNSRIRFMPPKNDTYQLIATTFAGGTGAYTLKVRTADAGKKDALPASADGKVHAVGAGLKIESKIDQQDPKDRVRRGAHAKVYEVKMNAGKTYTIDMESTEIDSYLRLEDAAGKQLAEDDDGGDNLNARITHRAAATGTYRIITTTFGSDTGPFTLRVREE